MHRNEYRAIALLRLAESRVLLDAGRSSGAYYLAGYAVECGLKACIARRFRLHDVPDPKVVARIYTHDLSALVGLAELAPDLTAATAADAIFRVNWAVVKDWNSASARYEQHSEQKARDMYAAVSNGRHGVMRWIKQRW